jgi:hypothetical protein
MSSSQLRLLREDDADAVAALFVEGWGESRRMDGAEIREWFNNEALKPENLLVLEDEGHVAGYFDAENPTGATRFYERAGMHVLRQSNTWERQLDDVGSTESDN